jgi:hypothetical protein
MSTQRREIRSTPQTKTCPWGPRFRWQRSDCTANAEASEAMFPAPNLRHVHASANGGTAPPVLLVRFHPSDENLSPGTPAATNSLQLDYRSAGLVWFCQFVLLFQLMQLVQLVYSVRLLRQKIRLGSPPSWALRRTATGTPATFGSFLPHIPIPSGSAFFYPALPQIPAGRRRWAERYDGKRDLHLQHAA